jgi:hypothetical protein
MNYKILGSDQKEYGPVSLEQLRQWMGEGRVNAQTMVQPEGATDWQPVSAFPELMPLTALTPSPLGAEVSPLAAQASAASQINGPAIGLLVTGILGAVGGVLGIVMNALGTSLSTFGPARGGDQSARLVNAMAGGAGIVQSLIHMALAGLIIYGALQMKKLVNFRLAMTVSILALAPCISPCCLLGLPFGIWALVVLNKPEVKSAFQ